MGRTQRKINSINLGQVMERYNMVLGKKEIKKTPGIYSFGMIILILTCMNAVLTLTLMGGVIISITSDNSIDIVFLIFILSFITTMIGVLISCISIHIGKKQTKYELTMYNGIVEFKTHGISVVMLNWVNSSDNREHGNYEADIVYNEKTQMRLKMDSVLTEHGMINVPCIEVSGTFAETYKGVLGYLSSDGEDFDTAYRNGTKVRLYDKPKYKYQIYGDIRALNDFINVVERTSNIRVMR